MNDFFIQKTHIALGEIYIARSAGVFKVRFRARLSHTVHISECRFQYVCCHWPNYCVSIALLPMPSHLTQSKENLLKIKLQCLHYRLNPEQKFGFTFERGILYFWSDEKIATVCFYVILVYFIFLILPFIFVYTLESPCITLYFFLIQV